MFTSTILDKFAISLSLLCALHCLAMPVLLVTLPSLAALQFDAEAFHIWMLAAVFPTSLYALTMGCKQHKRFFLMWVGVLGLISMVAAVTVGESLFGEWGEKGLTLLGASLLTIGHVFNFLLCQKNKDCGCANEASTPKV